MNCFDKTNCPQQNREACSLWNAFKDNPHNMENIKCWILNDVKIAGNNEIQKKCRTCNYYLSMNNDSDIISNFDTDIAYITCKGAINNDKNTALEKAWLTLKDHKKNKILLDLSDVNNIFSSGLGTIIAIHKSTQSENGLLVIICTEGYVKNLFQLTKLSRILKIVGDSRQAMEAFEAHNNIQSKAAQKFPEKKTEKEKQQPNPRPSCHDYWNNKNPRNPDSCDVCLKKIKQVNQPCWMIDDIIEGVIFYYVNESCESCRYFKEFGAEHLQ